MIKIIESHKERKYNNLGQSYDYKYYGIVSINGYYFDWVIFNNDKTFHLIGNSISIMNQIPAEDICNPLNYISSVVMHNPVMKPFTYSKMFQNALESTINYD